MKRKLGVIFVLCFLFPLFLISVALANSNPLPPPNSPPYPPKNPLPADEAVVENRDVTISWQCSGDPDGDSVVYDVYFGTTGSPPFSRTQAGTSYSAGTLDFKTYYWRIVVRDGKGGVTVGSVWSFTVFQNLEVSVNATQIDWWVIKPGVYFLPEAIEITVRSNGKVDLELVASNLVNPSGSIETWYAVGNDLGGAESFGWKKSFTISLNPTLTPSGITIRLWNKIKVTNETSSCEYENKSPVITFHKRG